MKKIVTVMLVICMTFFSIVSLPVARANPVAIAAGGVEVGAIAFWGGAVLVAAAGTAVGMDKELMSEVSAFGRHVWDTANDSMRAALTSSIGGMKDAWNTASSHVVTWTGEAQAYLKKQWDDWFGAGVRIDEKTGKIVKVATLSGVVVPSTVQADPWGSSADLGQIPDDFSNYYIKAVSVDLYGVPGITLNQSQPLWIRNEVTSLGTFPNAMAAYKKITEHFKVKTSYQTVAPTFVDMSDRDMVKYKPISYPASFPPAVTLPAPRGWADADGKVTGYQQPTIGRVGAVLGGDIAVGFPDVVGDIGQLQEKDSIKAPPVTVPGTGTGTGVGEAVAKDVSSIKTDVGTITGTIGRFFDFSRPVKWDRLKNIPALVTNKFPFSLPWDVKNAVGSLIQTPELPVLHSSIRGYDFNLDISPMLSPLAPYIRSAVVLLFTLGLVLLTPRLMGGAK